MDNMLELKPSSDTTYWEPDSERMHTKYKEKKKMKSNKRT